MNWMDEKLTCRRADNMELGSSFCQEVGNLRMPTIKKMKINRKIDSRVVNLRRLVVAGRGICSRRPAMQ